MSDQVKFCGISTEQGIIKALRCIAKCADVKCSDCEIDGYCSKDKIGIISANAADLIEAQAAEIEKLKAQVPRWIPVADKIPPDQEEVLVLTQSKNGVRNVDKGYWAIDHFIHRGRSEVTHWMPLPGVEV